MIRTHWPRGRPKIETPLHRGLVGVELAHPRITVAEKSHIIDDKPELRSIGLSIEQGDVYIEIAVPDPQELIRDLVEAEAWRSHSSAPVSRKAE